jgi:Carboxypeptidase regulatory-like domain
MSLLPIARIAFLTSLLFMGLQFVAAQQTDGRLVGKVSDSAGKPLAGVVVAIVHQTSSETKSVVTDSNGLYRMRLWGGAYRISVEPPFEARFDRGKVAEYGVFSNIICDETKKKCTILENVIIGGDIETKIDFQVERPESQAISLPQPDSPAGAAGSETVKSAEPKSSTRRELRDRWRIGFPEYDRYGDKGARGRDIPFKRNRWWNPYDQNVIKGDYPIIGNDYFLILSAASTSQLEIRRTPSASNVSANNPGSTYFFGRPESLSFNQTLQFSFEFFKGQTTFKPRDWAIKISPTVSVPNYLNARENGIVNIDVRRGTNRTDYHFSLEEAFAEVKLFDTNDNYDAVSIRAGIQPFTSDFRGFLYTDNNLGVRLFGAFSNNKIQFNAAYFRQLEKDTNSNLNSLTELRKQDIFIANIYRQDFLVKGYTIQAIAAYNHDHADTHTDTNGFIVRPALVGSAREHAVKVGYAGFNGDGHIGLINLTHSFYYAFGNDDFNPIAGKATKIRAKMAAAEVSIDKDFMRYRGSVFYASGDKNPTDDKANGFDAIFDDPNFVGGQFSYWNRQGLRLVSTEVGLVQPNSLLPSLRSSKTEGQANFVNPGIQIFNAGVDAELTQRIKAIFNANYLRFDRTESLEYVLFQPGVRHEIGYDLSLGVVFRPLLVNNITFTFGGSYFFPGKGFRDIYTDRNQNCPIPNFCMQDVPNPAKRQYSLFAQMKFIF